MNKNDNNAAITAPERPVEEGAGAARTAGNVSTKSFLGLNWRGIWAIARKDLKEILRNKASTIPALTMPVLLFAIVPVISMIVCNVINNQVDGDAIRTMIPATTVIPEGIDGAGIFAYLVFIVFYVPMFLISPVLLANILSAGAFVTENSGKTLESLMSTRMTAIELVISKSLAAFVPTFAINAITWIVYGLIVDGMGIGLGLFPYPVFPNWTWVAVLIITSPLISMFSIILMCFISQRVSSAMSASGLGLVIILPMISILALQSVGNLTFKSGTLIVLTVALIIADILGVLIVAYTTDSESMLLRRSSAD